MNTRCFVSAERVNVKIQKFFTSMFLNIQNTLRNRDSLPRTKCTIIHYTVIININTINLNIIKGELGVKKKKLRK